MTLPDPRMKFYLQPGPGSRESMAVITACMHRTLEGPEWSAGTPDKYPEGFCPFGDVEFVQDCLAIKPKPDYYPDFLAGWMHRAILKRPHWYRPTFVKSQKSYKHTPANIMPPQRDLPFPHTYETPTDPVFVDVVKFVQEWRYYVTAGTVVASGWYDGGDDDDEPAPVLDVDWPEDFSGAVDFGRLDTGQIALVESHHPFACGWYGESEDNEVYANWLWDGFEYLKRTEMQ